MTETFMFYLYPMHFVNTVCLFFRSSSRYAFTFYIVYVVWGAAWQQRAIGGLAAESLVLPQDRQQLQYIQCFGAYHLLPTKSSPLPICCAWSATVLCTVSTQCTHPLACIQRERETNKIQQSGYSLL